MKNFNKNSSKKIFTIFFMLFIISPFVSANYAYISGVITKGGSPVANSYVYDQTNSGRYVGYSNSNGNVVFDNSYVSFLAGILHCFAYNGNTQIACDIGSLTCSQLATFSLRWNYNSANDYGSSSPSGFSTCTYNFGHNFQCTPNCAGKQCGDNGCGGSCGACSSLYTCLNGQCSAPTPTYSFSPTQLNIGSTYTSTVSNAAPNSAVTLHNCPPGGSCGDYSVGTTDSNGYLSGSGTIDSGFVGGSYIQSVTVAGKTSNSITFTVQVCNPLSRCDNTYKYCRDNNIRNYASCNVFDFGYDASCTGGSTLGKCCSVNSECPSGQKCSGGTCVALNCPTDLGTCSQSTSNCQQTCGGTPYYCLQVGTNPSDWQWRTSVPRCNADVPACTHFQWPDYCNNNCGTTSGSCYAIGGISAPGSIWKYSTEQVCMDGTSPAQYGSCSTCASLTDSYGNAKVAIGCSATTTCNNQCALGTTKCSTSTTRQTCNNYNSDPCYEWGGDTNCQFGCDSTTNQCKGDPCAVKTCNSPPSPQCINSNTLRTFNSVACSNGACNYNSYSDSVCSYTCVGGSCCTPSLSCPAWDATCPISGTQTRTCTDVNACGYYSSNQVTELRTCTPNCPSVLPSCTPSTTCEESGGIRKSDGTYTCPGWYCRYGTGMGWITPGDLSINCDSAGEYCKTAQCGGNTYYCLARNTWTTCSGSTPYCYSGSGACNTCSSDSQCSGSTPYCTSSGCRQCTSDSQCTSIPATTCANNVQTTYSGSCSSNSCTYPSTQTTCQYGCNGNVCRTTPPTPSFSLVPTTMTLGSSWTITVTGASPNAPVALNCYGTNSQGNCGIGIPPSLCTTDANGACTITGSVPNDQKYVGTYTQSVTVYGTTSNSISFNVLPACPTAGTFVNGYSYLGCAVPVVTRQSSAAVDSSYGCSNAPTFSCYRCNPGYYYSSAANDCVPACPATGTGTPTYTGCQSYAPTNSVSVALGYGCQYSFINCYQCISGYTFENPLNKYITPAGQVNCIPICPSAGAVDSGYVYAGCKNNAPANTVWDSGKGCGTSDCFRCSSFLDTYDSTINACCGGRNSQCCGSSQCNTGNYCTSAVKCCKTGEIWSTASNTCIGYTGCTPSWTSPGSYGSSANCNSNQMCCPNAVQIGQNTYESGCLPVSTY